MVATVIFTVATGTALGFLSGLGIGGGSLLILWLTLVQGVSQEIARGINLLFFLPSAAIAVFFRFQKEKPNLQVIIPALMGGIAGAVLLGIVTGGIDTQMLRKPFGFLLLFTGLREIFYKPQK